MDSILLGVPTLNRYDLLECLIASAEAGTIKPKGYVIIDNGGSLQRNPNWNNNVEIIRPGRNLGVAASWNLLLRMAGNEPVVISNDDITLGPTSFAEILEALERGALLVNAGEFAIFAQTPECTRRVGYFDETFYPAYFEDSDYEWRCHLAGVIRTELTPTVEHVGYATSKALNDQLTQHFAWQRANHEYYLRKWGGTVGQEQYMQPFNGTPPVAVSKDQTMQHWDIVNYLARKIGAQRYLEIGVSSGESLERVDVVHKWGVDPYLPNAVIDAMRVRRPPIATTLLRMTSLAFFDTVVVPDFDLIFIDGDHRADLVYEEVSRSLPLLSRNGVIVLHDCNPPTEEIQLVTANPPTGCWTGDVWKAVVRLRREGVHDVLTVDTDWGCAVIRPHRGRGPMDLPPQSELSYALLEQNRQRFLGLVSVADFLRSF
jgi:hypothetical protein